MKILNLYACLGGNRFKWNEVAEEANIEIEVTAVELDAELAKLYQKRFLKDRVIVGDAHQYLLEHYKEYDFIWTSPPCPTHSRMNYTFQNRNNFELSYPDLKLYEEIIFLDTFFKGKYCVENVIPYYEPLIPAKKRGRHLYWTIFNLPYNLNERKSPPITANSSRKKGWIERMCNFHQIDLTTYKGKQSKEKISNNLVDYEAGRTIFERVLGITINENKKQIELF